MHFIHQLVILGCVFCCCWVWDFRYDVAGHEVKAKLRWLVYHEGSAVERRNFYCLGRVGTRMWQVSCFSTFGNANINEASEAKAGHINGRLSTRMFVGTYGKSMCHRDWLESKRTGWIRPNRGLNGSTRTIRKANGLNAKPIWPQSKIPVKAALPR